MAAGSTICGNRVSQCAKNCGGRRRDTAPWQDGDRGYTPAVRPCHLPNPTSRNARYVATCHPQPHSLRQPGQTVGLRQLFADPMPPNLRQVVLLSSLLSPWT